MAYKPSQAALNKAYEKGFKDGQRGLFNPPKGDGLVDFIFGGLDRLSGSPSTREMAEAVAHAYREGHSAGSRR
ncbi:MAG: hypothetical protein J0M19_00935 [Sphingomonadales bacterium]|nr:hypothetical protein [Sphingomonadales bacterium]